MKEVDSSSGEETVPGKVTWLERDAQGARLGFRHAFLEAQGPTGTAVRRPLSDFKLVVGTAPTCDLMLEDPLLSRRHFELQRHPLGFRLRDLGSTNGTVFHQARVGDVILSQNDQFRAGRFVFSLCVTEGQTSLPLASAHALGPLVGRSPGMRQVFAWVERMAEVDSNVLFQGETGTGKDLVAETLHRRSRRADGPLVVVDCAALQPNLVASELFGHAKGAFTGAERGRAGAFEEADGGTLFLDEVGELPRALQPQLLRALERSEVKRLGENHYRKVDVRVISATHRDLNGQIETGDFRQDLFYRLAVVQVYVPPLRCRLEDVEPLAKKFVKIMCPGADSEAIIGPDTLRVLTNHDWPGNVRELRNVVERLLAFPGQPELALHGPTSASVVSSRAERPEDYSEMPFYDARRRWESRFEKDYLNRLMRACEGVVSRAAKRAGISRQTLYRLLEKHGLV